MSFIGTVEAGMPPGFRFHPRDDELVLDYLFHRLSGRRLLHGAVAIVDVDLNKCEPWDLPDAACVGGREWYFFSLRDRKYATGQRTNRATHSGYWKATGKDRPITAGAGLVGMRKTLVFYQGRAPKGSRTEWVMHEFRLEQNHHHHHHQQQQDAAAAAAAAARCHLKEDWVLCRVFYKSRTITGPRPPSEEACTFSSKPDLPVAPSSLIDAYIAFDGVTPMMTAVEQVSCFSGGGLPALPSRGSVSFGDLLDWDTSEKKTIRTVLNNMSSSHTSKLELTPNWSQESGLSHMWEPL